MKKSIVTVQFIYEGISLPSENRRGVLLGDNKVFISDKEGPGIYVAEPTDDSSMYLVNLDKNDTDYLTDPEMLIDLIVA